MATKLGQNFLKNNDVIDSIIEVSDLSEDDVVLEIGPGKGILTEELAKNAGKVIAIEVDSSLIKGLRNRLRNHQNAEIVNNDILDVNLPELFAKYQIPNTKYKLIANIPYYITSRIIRLFLESDNSPKEMILMVQKEVAERIVAQPGKMNILAVSVQYYADVEILFEVSKEDFEPIPEVDSAVIRIKNHESRIKNYKEVRKFFRVVKAGFCARRKTLVNNLSNSLHMDKKEVREKMELVGILPTVRPQELSIQDWKDLVKVI